MTIHEALAQAALFMASQRQAASLKGQEEEETLWRYLRALSDFVHVTGQVYRFEDSLARATPPGGPHVSSAPSTRESTLAQRARELLRNLLAEAPKPEQQHVRVLIALLDFITDTGQSNDFEDFSSNQLEYAPVAIAHFTSGKEAESWLRNTSELPSPARILIGDDYHQFWYMREDQTRGMYRDYAVEPAMEALTARGIPTQAPSFDTRAEAEEWLMNNPARPYAFVAIAGEYYFAVYHLRLRRHSLHHVASTLKAWEGRKKAVEHAADLEAATPSNDASE